MKRLIPVLFLTISSLSFAQKKHFVYLTDKDSTPYSIDNPIEFLSQKSIDRRTKHGVSILKRDLPVNPVYIDSLSSLGAEVWYPSRWFNAVLIKADSITMDSINALGFVNNSTLLEKTIKQEPFDEVQWLNDNTKQIPVGEKGPESLDYGQSYNQSAMIGVNKMHSLGYDGSGLTIAVMDNGFSNVNIINAFSNLINENRVLGTYDFVENNDSVYDVGSHGTMVLSTMAAFSDNEMIGTAYGASYYLFVTENVNAELLDEEVNWLIAAERADSLGVDLINTSLGYSQFQDASMNHVYADLDGKTTIISKASEIAANTGMLIVSSAGNEAGNGWHYIRAPGDADSIITAGAININWEKTSFSSVGPTADGRIKPDLCALGKDVAVVDPFGSVLLSNGTSFSAPILCGLAAGFWQAHPELTSHEVIDYLKQSATQYNNPDTLQGWGVPNFKVAHVLAGGTIGVEKQFKNDVFFFPNPIGTGDVLSLSGKEKIEAIEIRNGLDQLVYDKIFNQSRNKQKISIPLNLREGVYTIKILNHANSYSERIIIKKK